MKSISKNRATAVAKGIVGLGRVVEEEYISRAVRLGNDATASDLEGVMKTKDDDKQDPVEEYLLENITAEELVLVAVLDARGFSEKSGLAAAGDILSTTLVAAAAQNKQSVQKWYEKAKAYRKKSKAANTRQSNGTAKKFKSKTRSLLATRDALKNLTQSTSLVDGLEEIVAYIESVTPKAQPVVLEFIELKGSEAELATVDSTPVTEVKSQLATLAAAVNQLELEYAKQDGELEQMIADMKATGKAEAALEAEKQKLAAAEAANKVAAKAALEADKAKRELAKVEAQVAAAEAVEVEEVVQPKAKAKAPQSERSKARAQRRAERNGTPQVADGLVEITISQKNCHNNFSGAFSNNTTVINGSINQTPKRKGIFGRIFG